MVKLCATSSVEYVIFGPTPSAVAHLATPLQNLTAVRAVCFSNLPLMLIVIYSNANY